MSKNNPPGSYKRLDKAELKAVINDWAKDYPCIEKISLYRMKMDKVFPDGPKYVFVVVAPDPPPKSDRETESAQSIIKYYNETYESCSHLDHVMEDFYRIDKLPENKLPDNYQEEWFWFSIEPGEHIEDYEMVMDVKPLVLFEREDQPCSAVSIAETSTVEPSSTEASTSEDIDDFPENYINSFTFKDEYWAIRYRGKEILIRDLERIRYIIHLLERPNRKFYVRELIDLVKGHTPTVNQEYSKMDAKQLENEGLSLTEFHIENLSPEEKRGLEDVVHKQWEALIEAEKLGGEKQVKAQDDWAKMVNYMLPEYGLNVYPSAKGPKFNYKPRWKNNIQKARIAVKNNINRAIKGLRSNIPALEEYLDEHIHTGVTCVYRPDFNDPIEWVIHW